MGKKHNLETLWKFQSQPGSEMDQSARSLLDQSESSFSRQDLQCVGPQQSFQSPLSHSEHITMSKVTATTLVHYQEVQEILNEYRLLHETMMRSSALYKTTYRQLSTKMSALEKKLGGTPPDILSLLFEYVGLPRTESVPAAAAAKVPSSPPPSSTTTTTTTTGDETRVVDAKKKTPKRKQSHPHKQATPVKKQKRDRKVKKQKLLSEWSKVLSEWSKPDLKKKKKTISKKKPTPTGKKSPEKRRMNRHAWEKLPNWLKLVWPLEEDANVPHYPLAMETDLDGTDRETDTAGKDMETDTAVPDAAPDVASVMDLPTMTPMELEGGLEKALEAQGCCPPPVAPAAVEQPTQQQQQKQWEPHPVFKYPELHINPVIPSWLKEEQEQEQQQQHEPHPVFMDCGPHINPVFPDDPFQENNLTATQKNCKACLHNNQCRLLNITDQGNYMCHLCLRVDKVCQGECFYGLLSEDMPDFTGHLFPSECLYSLKQQENKNC